MHLADVRCNSTLDLSPQRDLGIRTFRVPPQVPTGSPISGFFAGGAGHESARVIATRPILGANAGEAEGGADGLGTRTVLGSTLFVASSSTGQDDENATTVFSLDVVGGGATTLTTTDGLAITLVERPERTPMPRATTPPRSRNGARWPSREAPRPSSTWA